MSGPEVAGGQKVRTLSPERAVQQGLEANPSGQHVGRVEVGGTKFQFLGSEVSLICAAFLFTNASRWRPGFRIQVRVFMLSVK